MPRLHVIVQRYVPRWVIEVALVAAALQIYRQTLHLRTRFLDHPIMVFLTAVWRWYVLRKRLLRSDGAMDLAREAAATATSAADKAGDEIAEAQSHTSAAERELAVCRLAIAEMQQALQRVEQEHKKEKREMALERVRLAAKLAAPAGDETGTKKSPVSKTDAAATLAPKSAGRGDLDHAVANVGRSVRRALMDIDQSNIAATQLGLRTSDPKLELARREDGSVDLRSVGVQQAFIKSFNSDLVQPQTGVAGSDRVTTGSARADTGLAGKLSCAEISEVDFTVTDSGELARVCFDLRYRQPADHVGGVGAAGSTSATGAAPTVQDVE